MKIITTHRFVGWALPTLLLTAPALAVPRNVKSGDRLEEFTLNDLDGQTVDTAAWRGAPSVWIFVSATQRASEQGLRDVQAAIDQLAGANVRAVAITTDAVQAPYFRQFRTRQRIRIPVVLDPDRAIYGRVGVIVLPTTLLIDKEGRLHHAIPGHRLDYAEEILARLTFLAGRISETELKRRLTTTQPARDPTRERAERLVQSADIMFQRGLMNEAAAELQRAIETDPAYLPAYTDLARLRVRGGDLKGAETLIDDVLKRDARNRHALLVLGMIRFHQGRLDDAEKQLTEALVLNPDPARTHYWLGRVYQQRGDQEKAAAHYRQAVERLVRDLAEPMEERRAPSSPPD